MKGTATVFEYFPGNYVWNLAVVGALNSGGLIDEVDRACRPIREAAARGEDAGTGDFLAAWTELTDQLEEQAEAALVAGHARTAGELYFRATNYLCNAERMQSASSPGRVQVYRRVLQLAQSAIELPRPAGDAGGGPVRGHHPARLLQSGASRGVRSGPGDHLVERARFHQGAHVHLLALGRAGRPGHLLPHGRLPWLRRGAAAAGTHRAGRQRGVGGGVRRLPAHPP